MEPALRRARDAVRAASAHTDDSAVHEQLASIEAAIETLSGDESPADDAVTGDRLEEIERQLVELGEDADGAALRHVETARDQLDAYRRADAQDWE